MSYPGAAYGRDEPYLVPDIVKQFVVYLYNHIRERNITEIQSMYEISFPKLSERYFKTTSWPPVEYIADLVEHDHVFCMLYKELYYRHLYAKTLPDLRQRCESWDNYCDLFGVILHGSVNMVLPNTWLWDMVDEFIYQFQSFCKYRAKVAQKSFDEVELLKKCSHVWNVADVLNVLQALVDRAKIVRELELDGGAKLVACDGYLPNQSNVLRMLGYFSLVGLCRVHCLVGDYCTGLRALYPLNLFDRASLYTPKIPVAHITLYYHASFCYVMMRRYHDAARCLNTVLGYINRVKQFHQRSAAYEHILKRNEQMYALLALCAALSPAAGKALDEAVATQLKEKAGEKMQRLSNGEIPVYDELFSYACPHFITAAPPAYDGAASASASASAHEANRNQLQLFIREVRSQQVLPSLKQYLILYSSISMAKLASLLDTEAAALRTTLLTLKTRSQGVRYDSGSDMTSGVVVSNSDIDFHIDVDPASGEELVIVQEAVQTRHHAEVLARHISRFEEIVRDLEAPPVAAKGAA